MKITIPITDNEEADEDATQGAIAEALFVGQLVEDGWRFDLGQWTREYDGKTYSFPHGLMLLIGSAQVEALTQQMDHDEYQS